MVEQRDKEIIARERELEKRELAQIKKARMMHFLKRSLGSGKEKDNPRLQNGKPKKWIDFHL